MLAKIKVWSWDHISRGGNRIFPHELGLIPHYYVINPVYPIQISMLYLQYAVHEEPRWKSTIAIIDKINEISMKMQSIEFLLNILIELVSAILQFFHYFVQPSFVLRGNKGGPILDLITMFFELIQ